MTSEELIVLGEKLDYQNQEINRQRDTLLENEQRYKLAIEVASDGIWDWNFLDNKCYFSILEQSYRVRSIYGDYRWILSNGQAIFDENGIPRRMIGTHKDITNQKKWKSNFMWL